MSSLICTLFPRGASKQTYSTGVWGGGIWSKVLTVKNRRPAPIYMPMQIILKKILCHEVIPNVLVMYSLP
jgi:hypothetical protein